MTTNNITVTKTLKGNKVIYTWGDKILRTSKRDYNFALFGLCSNVYNKVTKEWSKRDEDLEWRFICMGNNPQNVLNTGKSYFKAFEYSIITIK